MRKQRVVLKHRADVAFVRLAMVYNFAFEQNVAGGGLFETGNQAKGRGLAATRGAQQGEETSLRNRKRNTVQSALARILLHQLAHFQIGLFH